MSGNKQLNPRRRIAWRRTFLQRGVVAIEYALIASLICFVIVISVGAVGVEVRALYDDSEKNIVAAIKGALGRLGV